MNEVRIVGNDVIISVDEVVANMENAALIEDNKRLQAENAKLLELLRPLVDFADYECNLMYDCTACQMISGDRPCYLVKALRYLHDLGVDE